MSHGAKLECSETDFECPRYFSYTDRKYRKTEGRKCLMDRLQHYFVNISAPNLVVICVDNDQGEESGRMYHCYESKPQQFSSVLELIRSMEEFFDHIAYPQASTMTRYFPDTGKKEGDVYDKPLPPKVAEQKEIIRYRGEKGTYIVHVQYRQNSDWQGQVSCPDKEIAYKFSSTLEFIKILSQM